MFRRKSRLTTKKKKELLRYFAQDYDATKTSLVTGINRNTVNLYFNHFREKIFDHLHLQPVPKLDGEVEIDHAFFGRKSRRVLVRIEERIDSKGGKYLYRKKAWRRGICNQIKLFGIFQRDGVLYTQIIEKADKATLFPIIKNIIKPGTTIYSDGWSTFDRLSKEGYKHCVIKHTERYAKSKTEHTGHIEYFWGFSKRRLGKFSGLSRKTYALHLKECEFRRNCQIKKEDLFSNLLEIGALPR